jgi:hypothetical protein
MSVRASTVSEVSGCAAGHPSRVGGVAVREAGVDDGAVLSVCDGVAATGVDAPWQALSSSDAAKLATSAERHVVPIVRTGSSAALLGLIPRAALLGLIPRAALLA